MVIPSAKAKEVQVELVPAVHRRRVAALGQGSAVYNRAEGGDSLFNQVAGDDPGRQEARLSDLLVGMGMG